MPTAAARPTRNRPKAARKSKAVSAPLYRIEQNARRDYTKLPHDGFVYAQIVGGELLGECKKIIAEQKQVLKKRDEYFKRMALVFGIPVVGNYGYNGHISELVLEVPLPKTLRRFYRDKPEHKDYDAYTKARKEFRAEHEKPFHQGAHGPWRIHDSFFSVPLAKELKGDDGRADDTVLQMRVKPHLNKTNGRAEHANLEALRLPQGSDIASRIAPDKHHWVTRGPAPRGGIFFDDPDMRTLGKWFILRLPISSSKPQPKELYIAMGTAVRLTMSEFWQLREKARD